ncbi:SH3 domain-containing protein [Sedimentitalea todarodis]|uniref:SH3 domain-containing protein n=1 Tax=Sedimentitalea todarodis TaxID=1631240 RepID=A0ABU3VHD1_9RHOB|nr:SH3 domain-containing protein [Sedimentitalea todarodis]MDU9005596.1 SH3 domain-containing protein [Sedimentitalea todarodis]
MRRAVFAVLAATVLGTVMATKPAEAGPFGLHEVIGVEDDDMLKLRAGPGIGYKILLGLPNGTVVRLHGCDQTGGTRWCKVSLKQSRAVKGYVSWAYLQKI